MQSLDYCYDKALEGCRNGVGTNTNKQTSRYMAELTGRTLLYTLLTSQESPCRQSNYRVITHQLNTRTAAMPSSDQQNDTIAQVS